MGNDAGSWSSFPWAFQLLESLTPRRSPWWGGHDMLILQQAGLEQAWQPCNERDPCRCWQKGGKLDMTSGLSETNGVMKKAKWYLLVSLENCSIHLEWLGSRRRDWSGGHQAGWWLFCRKKNTGCHWRLTIAQNNRNDCPYFFRVHRLTEPIGASQ